MSPSPTAAPSRFALTRFAPTRFDVVALATSAGGLGALSAVLGAIPADFGAAVLVMQHLGRYGSALVEILAERCRLPVAWVADGDRLTPGRVFVCPPQRMVDVHPDGTCSVRAGVHRAPDLPIDALFHTLAASLGARALAVVLTGLGRDGADGVRALGRAGAIVLAQTAESAEYPAMPRAAVATGAADLVLPLDEIGPMLAHVVAGGALPRPPAEVAAGIALFAGHGATRVGPLLAAIHWAATPLGPVTGWPPALRAAVRLAMTSHVAMDVFWGPEFVQIPNDAAADLRGADVRGADPRAAGLGLPARETWTESAVSAMLARVVRTGEAMFVEGPPAAVSCAPILDPAAPHGVGGVLHVATETAARAPDAPPETLSRSGMFRT